MLLAMTAHVMNLVRPSPQQYKRNERAFMVSCEATYSPATQSEVNEMLLQLPVRVGTWASFGFRASWLRQLRSVQGVGMRKLLSLAGTVSLKAEVVTPRKADAGTQPQRMLSETRNPKTAKSPS